MNLLTPQEEAEARAQGAEAQAIAAEAARQPTVGSRSLGAATQLYDQSGKPISLTPEDATKAIASGAATVRADAAINVVGPDGAKASVPGPDLALAVQRGYRLETDHERGLYDYLQQNEGLAGAAKVTMAKALSELAFGVPEIAYEHTATPAEREQWEALKSEHPLASGVGSAVGFAGSTLVGAPLFKAATAAGKAAEGAVLVGREAGLGARIAANVARVGTEGAVISAPQVITEAALGDPKAAAEHLAWGLGGGAVLGAAGTLASSALKPLGKLAAGAVEHLGVDMHATDPLKGLAEGQAFRSLMHSQDERTIKLAQSVGGPKAVGRYVLDENLLRVPNESFEKYSTRIGERKQQVGEQIGAAYRELDAAGARGPSAEELADRFQAEVIDPLKLKATKANEVARLEQFKGDFLQSSRLQREARMDSLESPGQSLYDLWETRKDLASRIYQDRKALPGAIANPVDRELDRFRVMLDDAVEGSAPPAFKGKIDELNRHYRNLSTIDQIVDKSVLREAKNRNFSLSDMLTGHGAGVAMHSMGGALLGGPVGAVAGLGAALGHHYIRENGNSIVAKYANQLGTYFAHQAVQQGEKELGAIPRLLGRLPSSEMAVENGFHLFLGGESSKDDRKNFGRVAERLNSVAADPSRAQQHVQAVADVIGKGAPGVAQAYAHAEMQRAAWLQSQLPKPPPPAPFQAATKWEPTQRQMHEFAAKVAVAMDPRVVLRETARGTLTPAHVQAAKAMWPATYDQMVTATKTWGMTAAAKKLPYQRKVLLSLMIGEPVAPGMAGVAQLQNNFATGAPAAPAAKPLGKIPGSEYTLQQRIRA